jgi:ubiquinone/menaquinone biosynthesis C-methylase UbiE
MKTEWDYTNLAEAYLKRPDYSLDAIQAMLETSGTGVGSLACDVGAGVAHLTLMLEKAGLLVTSIEPNDAMRSLGQNRTAELKGVKWIEGTGENTYQDSETFNIVTFGSSFNVCDRQKALCESARILKDKGWFVCMWNHRDLTDPIQAEIESIIKSIIPEYGYGTRREDQVEVINTSGLFSDVVKLSGRILHSQPINDVVEAWRSHATLQRQAGELFNQVIDKIEKYLLSLDSSEIDVPYTTNIWMAQKL